MSTKLGELGTHIQALKEQIAKDIEMLKEATAVREKEAAKFREEEKDMVQALTNLNNAITVLSCPRAALPASCRWTPPTPPASARTWPRCP